VHDLCAQPHRRARHRGFLRVSEKMGREKGHCNMMMAELHEEKKLKEPTYVQVVTRGGINTGSNLDQGDRFKEKYRRKNLKSSTSIS
jgi:hypothetical protein